MLRFLSIVFYLERTNKLSLLPDKDLVDLCPPIEPYQVTKNPKSKSDHYQVK
ncbi:Glycogen phosphorylase [Microcystis panniformis FACHB-1757]|uniref:Glycogen phosphorylase n=1 Tax=Microcystis panniformis FACHB-1757 TaxID=1638788 RepID=A0A0K1S0I8_9CHRO|nr:Glycogen phosphorylase [Microcystis panniformis FACHB-1757]